MKETSEEDIKIKRKRIIIDIDGVIADQVTPIINEYNKNHHENLTKDSIDKWDAKVGDVPFNQLIKKKFHDPSFILEMPLINNCVYYIQKLFKEDNWIIIATSRPEYTDLSTINWLNRSGIKYHKYINASVRGKSEIEGDILIDDNLENVVNYAIKWGKAVLMEQPWNKDRSKITNLIVENKILLGKNWPTIYKLIYDFI